MDPRLIPLNELIVLNTWLLPNVLAGVDDELAQRRPQGGANNMSFIAAHIADARYMLASILGEDVKSPLDRSLDAVHHIDQVKVFPRLTEILAAWDSTSGLLRDRFAAATPAILDSEAPLSLPTEVNTVLAGATVLLQHESFHLGQMALLRRIFGLDAMSYLRD